MRNNEWMTTAYGRKCVEGKAGRDRPRTPFMKQVIEYTGKTTYKDLKVAVVDREDY